MFDFVKLSKIVSVASMFRLRFLIAEDGAREMLLGPLTGLDANAVAAAQESQRNR